MTARPGPGRSGPRRKSRGAPPIRQGERRMCASHRWGVLTRPWRRVAAIAVPLTAVPLLVVLGAVPAQAVGQRVNLRVLVVTSGDPGSLAVETELDREGIPFTEVDIRATGRPTIDGAYLEDAAAGTGRFQGVVLPNQAGGGLAAAEVSALSAYEAAYGVRQINAYDFPTTTMGAVFSGVSGTL